LYAFFFSASYQFTLLLNLWPHFQLNPIWLVYLHRFTSFFYGHIIFYLHYFDVCPIFREHTRASNKPFMYFSSKYPDFVICLGTKILNLPKSFDIDIPFSAIYFPYILFLFVTTSDPAILWSQLVTNLHNTDRVASMLHCQFTCALICWCACIHSFLSCLKTAENIFLEFCVVHFDSTRKTSSRNLKDF